MVFSAHNCLSLILLGLLALPLAATAEPLASPGDMRLLFSVLEGKPVCALYEARVRQADKAPKTFTSPVGHETFERMVILKGAQVAEKLLGIIGLGRVGYDVARCGVGLDMKVIGFDPFIDKQKAQDAGIELVSDPQDIYPRADYITVHTPMTPETEGMIGEKEFAMMKKGVRVLNCARGGIINEAALYDAIQSGQVAGAALDVFVDPRHRVVHQALEAGLRLVLGARPRFTPVHQRHRLR